MEREDALTPTQENYRSFQRKKEYTAALLGTEKEPGRDVFPPFWRDTVQHIDDNFPAKRHELRFLGGKIVSTKLAAEIRQKFDTREVKVFPLERVKQAIRDAGLHIFESQAEFPYSNPNIDVLKNHFLITKYSEPPETKDSNPGFYSRLPSILKNIFKGRKPRLTSKAVFIDFPQNPVVLPDIALRLLPPQQATFEVTKLTGTVGVRHDLPTVGKMILDQLDYHFSPIELSEPVVFVPIEKLVPNKRERAQLGSFNDWAPNKGAWYFQSEVGDFLDNSAATE